MRSKEFIREMNPFGGGIKDLANKAIKNVEPPKVSMPRDTDVNRLIPPAEQQAVSLALKLASGPKRVPLPGSKHLNVVKTAGAHPRVTVVVNVDGIPMPFYISTGAGGKDKVASGRWYEFWGIGPDGWFNKTTEADINNHYGSAKLKSICDQLDSQIGDIRNLADSIPVMTQADIQIINSAKRPMSYSDAQSMTDAERNAWINKIRTMGRTL